MSAVHSKEGYDTGMVLRFVAVLKEVCVFTRMDGCDVTIIPCCVVEVVENCVCAVSRDGKI